MKTSKEILRDSFAQFKRKWHLYIFIPIVAGLVDFALRSAFSPLLVMIGVGVSERVSSVGVIVGLALLALIAIIVLTVVSVFIQVIGRIAAVQITGASARGEDVTFMSTVKQSFRRVLPYIWVTILMGLVLFSSFMLFLIPGIILLFFITFATFANIIDGKKGLSALTYSITLVRGRAWKVFWKSMLPIAWFLAAFVVLLLGLGILVYMSMDAIPQAAMIIAFVLLGIIAIPVIFVGQSVIIIYMCKLYEELKKTVVPADSPDQLPGFFARLFSSEARNRTILKVFSWLSVGFIAAILVAVTLAYAFVPGFRNGFNQAFDAHDELSEGPYGELHPINIGTYTDYGISFAVPQGWEDVGRLEDELVTFVDTKNLDEEGSYVNRVSVQGNSYAEGAGPMTAKEIVETSYVPQIEESVKKGDIRDFSFTTKSLGMHDAAIVSFVETSADGRDINSYWAVITGPLGIYMFTGDSVVGSQGITQAIDEMVSELSFVDYQPAQ